MSERDPRVKPKPGDVARLPNGKLQTVYDCRLSATPNGARVMVTFENGGYRMPLSEYAEKAEVVYVAT